MNVVKNIIVLFLIVNLAVPGSVLHCITHIPEVVEHFKLHQEDHENVSIISFITDHLDSDNHSHKNSDAHDNLPFSHHHTAEYSQTITVFPSFNEIDFRFTAFSTSSLKIASKQHFHTSSYLQSIWQPPKLS
jgi:hypothetical protein